jgi:hypothetical protein
MKELKVTLFWFGLVLSLWLWLAKHEERLHRIEYWVEVHHPLIPTYASPAEVKERGYWRKGR